MGMRDFKTNKNKLSDGIWIELPANKDGSIPRVKVRAAGDFNPEYEKLQAKKVKKVIKVLSFNNPAADKARDAIVKEMTIEYVFADWEHMQPDDDGRELEFNHQNVSNIVNDDEWKGFVNYVVGEASTLEKFNHEQLEAIAGN